MESQNDPRISIVKKIISRLIAKANTPIHKSLLNYTLLYNNILTDSASWAGSDFISATSRTPNSIKGSTDKKAHITNQTGAIYFIFKTKVKILPHN